MAQFAQVPLCLFRIGEVVFAVDLLRGVAFDQMDESHRRAKFLSELSCYRKRSLCQVRTVKRDDQMFDLKFSSL